MTLYRCIAADPPWPYSTSRAVIGNGGRQRRAKKTIQVGVASHYPTMTIEELKNLNVGVLAESNAHLYLWTTNSFIVEAHAVARAWGFEPKTIITWVKKKANGKPSMKTGFYYRGATEHCLFCVKGSLRLTGKPHATVFETGRLAHSIKPPYFYRMVEQQSPGPYLELFSRKPRSGWDKWGNQLRNTIEIEVTE